ncbi:MAG: pyridoxal phosphate-dependent aminotransferase, partial [Planctomycetota bacterium]
NLSIGQPDFPVPQQLKDAACAAIHAERNSYTPTQGIAELREQCRVEERDRTGRDWSEDEVLITSGVSGGLILSLLALVQAGDQVLMADPYFVMYKHLVRLFDAEPVYIDTYDSAFSIDPDRLAAAITPRTRVLLLNSPANPTGTICDEERLRGIAAICQRHDILVVSDEIYRSFAYRPIRSIAEFHEQTLVLAGHSKAYGITGWRLGYAAGPRALIQAMAMVQQYSFVCAPSLAQYAALACPGIDMGPHLDAYRRKRDLMVDALSDRFEVAPADGAFYLWIKAPDGRTGTDFVTEAIANNVLIIPGEVFSERDSHFRVCYTVPDETLRAGAEVLRRLAGDG